MKDSYRYENWFDAAENPAGGLAMGTGLFIYWQDGPLGRGADRQPPNGAFVETVLDAVAKRLEFYQSSRFACAENAEALRLVSEAMNVLDARTKAREAAGVEGTHANHGGAR